VRERRRRLSACPRQGESHFVSHGTAPLLFFLELSRLEFLQEVLQTAGCATRSGPHRWYKRSAVGRVTVAFS